MCYKMVTVSKAQHALHACLPGMHCFAYPAPAATCSGAQVLTLTLTMLPHLTCVCQNTVIDANAYEENECQAAGLTVSFVAAAAAAAAHNKVPTPGQIRIALIPGNLCDPFYALKHACYAEKVCCMNVVSVTVCDNPSPFSPSEALYLQLCSLRERTSPQEELAARQVAATAATDRQP